MKIEKINERQIRCVLTKEDLETRKIRLSELVCGGEKARGLLRDMILRATRELNFSFNNNPLMIEAVPTGKDQLVLIITRVDDPKELDSRFRHLSGIGDKAKKDAGQIDPDKGGTLSLSGADDILNLLKKFAMRLEESKGAPAQKKADVSGEGQKADVPGQGQETAVPGQGLKADVPGQGQKAAADADVQKKSPKKLEEDLYRYTRFYLFRSLENVLSASKRVPEDYAGANTLYKNPDDGAFYLLIQKMDTDPEQFNRICNVLSEYSMPMDYSSGMDEFFREHMQVIVAENALQHLRSV